MEHLEGRQSVLAALRSRRRRINVILLRHGIHTVDLAEMLALAEEMGVPVRQVDPSEIDRMAQGATHGGVLAVASAKPRIDVDELSTELRERAANPLLLMLEGIDDDRNLGFVLRTAEACGAHAVLVKKHMWDFDPVEVARPSSGAYERLPLVQVREVSELSSLRKAGVRLIGCLAGVRRSIWDIDLTVPVMLAIGGEKRGLSGAMRQACDGFATIPTLGGASSLSLSHSAAIVLAEALRQRRAAGLTAADLTLGSTDDPPVTEQPE